MATLSSPGIGSGLDVKSIVAQLMAIERQPLAALQTATKKSQDQLSAYGQLQSAMTSLRDAAVKLSREDTWSATTVASSNAAAVAVTSDGSAPAGSYTVSVTRLAAAQTLVSPTALASAADGLGPGSLTIEFGTWGAGQTSFTPKAGASAVTLRFDIGSDSLEDVRDAINASGAGVTASVVSDASGARLSLRSTATGAENGFRIQVNDDDGDNGDVAGLSQLAFDPSSGVSRMTQGLAAANAQATVNGVPVSAQTNNLDQVLDGLSFKLSQVTTSPVDVTVSRDNDSIRKTVTTFASSYNDLVKMLRDQTRYDAATKTGGTLQGDASAVGLAQQLRGLGGSTSAAATDFTRLADIGLEPQSDGSLKVNDKKLDAAMAKLGELQTFFARDEAGSELDGFAALFKTFGDERLATEGVLSTRRDALQARIDRNNDRSDRLQDRLSLVEKRLTEQYARLDTSIAQLNSLQNYVTQQIASWNKRTA